MIAGKEAEQAGSERNGRQSSAPVRLPLFAFASKRTGGLAALALVAATAALYLGAARLVVGELGYPLDDAWIHQTYARNLAHFGEWSFVPGSPSAGSTSPLWTLLLAIIYRLPGDPHVWTYALGLAGLLATAWAGARLSLAIFGEHRLARWLAAAVLVEWHLAWAALSGMEILLYTFLAILLLALALAPDTPRRPFLWGMVGGLLTLTRPEGVWLVGLIGCLLLFRTWRDHLGQLALALGLYAAGCLIVVAPYILANWQLTGRPLPNTFYAKQAEYRILIETLPPWKRLLALAWLPWIGAQVLFLVGLVWVALRWVGGRRSEVEDQNATIRPLLMTGNRQRTDRSVRLLVPALWALGLVLVYALRLPVTYQHGRYLMPVIPIVLLYGLWAFRALVTSAPRLLSRSLEISAVLLFLLFWLRGGLAYAEDTNIITCEMVATARWLASETEPTDLIAAHDIGALGYFTHRPLLDLAGLISPETIPLLRDEPGLLSLMQARGVRYAVFFPDWYPALAASPALRLVAQQACSSTQAAGQQSLAVYATTWSSHLSVRQEKQVSLERNWSTKDQFVRIE